MRAPPAECSRLGPVNAARVFCWERLVAVVPSSILGAGCSCLRCLLLLLWLLLFLSLSAPFPPTCSAPINLCDPLVEVILRALDGLVEGGGDAEVGACLVELMYTIFRVLSICENLDRVRLLLVNVCYTT